MKSFEVSRATVDGNEAAASVAYRASEVIAIYPITPASAMGELADEWAAGGRPNLWGTVPRIQEMQSEAGAAGVVHGALQSGALSTTFTASQGLLLMVPNMFKIAGELTPFVLHVAARTIATHALSIFGDHSDVMHCRGTGFAMLCAASVQEAHDFAAVAHGATLESRVPFLHFFDGFRTSHELGRVQILSDEDVRAMLPAERIAEHRQRALNPDHPVIRGTAQNPDTYFQAREASNPYYLACPAVVKQYFERLAGRCGRRYQLFEYHGHPEAERVIVVMGSASETVRATVRHLVARGEKVGVVVVRLYRPFSLEHFAKALPASVRRIAVLDRTKEPGAIGEPLFLDVLAALVEREGPAPLVIGGRYGLSSKDLTPSMVASVYAELSAPKPRRRFTVGIFDDVTKLSLPPGPPLSVFPPDVFQAMFYGLGSDGTVGANKSTIKIVGESTEREVQGYFVYDSKKSGAATVSHLRFGKAPLEAPYLIEEADFVACHQYDFLEQLSMLDHAKPGATFLLNSPYGKAEIWAHLPREVQQAIIDKGLRFYVIDALQVARDNGLGNRINIVMQTCFWALTDLLPRERALAESKEMIAKSYEKKGADIVQKNQAAVEATLAHLERVDVPTGLSGKPRPPVVDGRAPSFVQRVTAMMMAGKGDQLPVSAFPPDGTWPVGTTQWEKRNLAVEIPVWNTDLCIQCNKCVLVCPHAAIRAKVYEPQHLEAAPPGFLSAAWRGDDFPGQRYTIQVAPEDCTGCQICAVVCPAKDKSNPRTKALMMEPQRPRREAERERYQFFLEALPEADRSKVKLDVKGTGLLQPLFEYSGACSGCGETPYIKALTQLFGDRLMIANATGCSSIYGGNLPTTPYTTDRFGRGPAWANSLFEDNAEFGLGFRLSLDVQQGEAERLLAGLGTQVGEVLAQAILDCDPKKESELGAQRARVAELKKKLQTIPGPDAARLLLGADNLVRKTVWIVGGDGWAYDIGFGGLDHVLASGADVNILVLDTGVYSNTGGQQSKATPLGAAAKFAANGKEIAKKDLGLIAMSYGHVYVAQIAFGARDAQTIKALAEADAHPGPSLVIAYSHCIAHGYDLARGPEQQKLAAESGVWPLYRVDPAREAKGEPALHIDFGGTPTRSVRDWALNEARFRMVERIDPKRFRLLQEQAQRDAVRRTEVYRQLAELRVKPPEPKGPRGAGGES